MSEWDGEVQEEVRRLTIAQEKRVLNMNALLRKRANLHQVFEIKRAISHGDIIDAKMYWSEFTQDEQRALWVAPTKGGIFTTAEREALHHKR